MKTILGFNFQLRDNSSKHFEYENYSRISSLGMKEPLYSHAACLEYFL